MRRPWGQVINIGIRLGKQAHRGSFHAKKVFLLTLVYTAAKNMLNLARQCLFRLFIAVNGHKGSKVLAKLGPMAYSGFKFKKGGGLLSSNLPPDCYVDMFFSLKIRKKRFIPYCAF